LSPFILSDAVPQHNISRMVTESTISENTDVANIWLKSYTFSAWIKGGFKNG